MFPHDQPAPARRSMSRKSFLATLGAAGAATAVGTVAFSPTAAATSTEWNVYDVRKNMDSSGKDAATVLANCLSAAAAKGGGHIYLGPGRYDLTKPVSVNINNAASISISGAGMHSTRLHCMNGTGAIKIVCNSADTQLTIEDLTILADSPKTPTAGTALAVVNTQRTDRHFRGLVVSNVEIRGAKDRTGGSSSETDYSGDYVFSSGVVVRGVRQPFLDNVVVAGINRIAEDPIRDANKPACFKMDVGIDLGGNGDQVGSYAPTVQNSYVWSAKVGIKNDDIGTSTLPEGSWFYNNTVVGAKIGYDISADDTKGDGTEPGLAIDRCHANARDVGIRIRRNQVYITNCLLYNATQKVGGKRVSGPHYDDIRLDHSNDVIIADNQFQLPFNTDRNAINVRCSQEILINGNIFSNRGTGVYVYDGPDRVDHPTSHVTLRNNMWSRLKPIVGGDQAAAVEWKGLNYAPRSN